MTDDELYEAIAPAIEDACGISLEPTGGRLRTQWRGCKGTVRTLQILRMDDRGFRTYTMAEPFRKATLSGKGPDEIIVSAYESSTAIDWSAAWAREVADCPKGKLRPSPGPCGDFWAVEWSAVHPIADGRIELDASR